MASKTPYIGDVWKYAGPEEGVDPRIDERFRRYNDWFECAYSSPEVKAARRRERHARWVAGITPTDWDRLERCAQLTMAGQRFARFDDLEAPIAVAVVHPTERLPNGERFGKLGGCVLMAFQKAQQ